MSEMRAVEVRSSKQISLSKSAAVLFRFFASETGAQPDVAAHLGRTVTAFNELVAVHREIRAHHKISPVVEEKEVAIQYEDSSHSMKKNKDSYYEGDVGNSKLEPQGEMDGSSKKKMEGLGDEKMSEKKRY